MLSIIQKSQFYIESAFPKADIFIIKTGKVFFPHKN